MPGFRRKLNRMKLYFGLFLALGIVEITGTGLLGCLLDAGVCDTTEVCYDDGIVGACSLVGEDVKRFRLSYKRQELLQKLISGLYSARYNLPDVTFQCGLTNFYLDEECDTENDVQCIDKKFQLAKQCEYLERIERKVYDIRNLNVDYNEPDLNADVALQRTPRLRNIRKLRLVDEQKSAIDKAPSLTPDEIDQLNANILSIKNNQKPDFSDINDDLLGKYIDYMPFLARQVRQMQQDREYDDSDYNLEGYTNGQILNKNSDNKPFPPEVGPDDERFLFKKDEEKLGIIDQGTGNKIHRIQTRYPNKVTPTPNFRWKFDNSMRAVQGNRVYLRLNKNLTASDMDYLNDLIEYLDKSIAMPNNLSFVDHRINKNELSFDVYYQENQATPQQIHYAFDYPVPVNVSGAGAVAEQAYRLVKKAEASTASTDSNARVIDAGIGSGPNSLSLTQALNSDDDKFLLPILVVCSLVIGTLICVMGLYFYRSRAESRKKFGLFLGGFESKPSKDYQDLCRQHMNGKPADERMIENLVGPGIVGTLAQRLGSQSEPSPPAVSSTRSSTSSWSEEPVQTNMDITTGHTILTYMEKHLLDKDMLRQEWENLEKYQPDVTSASVAQLVENLPKNRFADVLPYDHSRAKLLDIVAEGETDYINGSFICDHDPRNPIYVATQGPLPNTVADFWQMVWEQGSVVLVNLTKLTENGLPKCTRYWPENGSEIYRFYEVHLVSEHIWCTDYLVRSFYLKNLRTHETRTVTQFHFLTWPEDSLPISTKSLLDFRRKVNKSFRGRLCPIVVHCSDGSSRTGTYCLLDMVLNRINKGIKEIDIAATLEHLRDQRMKFVKSIDQFEFVLTCVAEEVQAVLKALSQ